MFKLEPAITAMIDATNRGDTEAFLAAFDDDATIVDFGRTFSGKRAIARWNSSENIGCGSPKSIPTSSRCPIVSVVQAAESTVGDNSSARFR